MAQADRRVLIDTSVLIAHLRGRLALQQLLQDFQEVFVSAVTLYELEYGATRAGRASDFAQLSAVLRPALCALDEAAVERAARMNGELAHRNKQIGPRDALIAGTALAHGVELLTLNAKEFRRVPDLIVAEPRELLQ